MSFLTTPLQLGYFFALLLFIVFWIRSFKENRISDFFLGSLFLLLALEIQDYTFGFSGINFLWEELNGFPRNVGLLIGPVFYFYLQSQTNYNFRFRKKYFVHFIPFIIYFTLELTIFIQGTYAVQEYQQSQIAQKVDIVFWITLLLSYCYYFYHSIQLYKNYRIWTVNHFSNTELISFKWFRNFIYILISCFLAKTIFQVLDFFVSLDFDEDWYWNLIIVFTIFYIGLTAISQRQGELLVFVPTNRKLHQKEGKPKVNNNKKEHVVLLEKLDRIMNEERLYLQSELTLSELSKHLNVNTNQLSACINQTKQQNFNDYINSLRIKAFEKNSKQNSFENFTLLALAFESGFNSKTTFNRAFKKEKGITPNEYLKGLKKG